MAIFKGDITLKKTQVMRDVPEGGGAPTQEVIPDGGNNTIFPDVSETDRAGGRFNLRKVVVHVDSDNTDDYLGANIVVARPPNDPNVSVALLSTASLFDQRSNAVNRVEAYLTPGAVWSGFLLHDHLAGQRTIQLFQRPGWAMPNVGRTLVLTYRAGQPDQRQQYVRILRREAEIRQFTYTSGSSIFDYDAQVVTCEISDALREDFPGSEPSRFFNPETGKTSVRDTTVADAGNYCGTQPLVINADTGAVSAKVASVYTQLVPNSRTERAELDVRPAGLREVVLQETPRRVAIGTAPHTRRLKISQENRSFSYVDILRPLPAPGTLDVSYMALGDWYSLQDDGAGHLTGAGVGTINYTTGSISVTLQALPDPGSMIVYTWGEKTAFANRVGQGGFRRPEYAFSLGSDGIVPGSVEITWTSEGIVRTATVGTNGVVTGAAEGEVNYAANMLLLRPKFMVDAGGEFLFECDEVDLVTDSFSSISLGPGGFATLPLSQVPVAGSVAVEWITVRNVSKTSGSDVSSAASSKSTAVSG